MVFIFLILLVAVGAFCVYRGIEAVKERKKAEVLQLSEDGKTLEKVGKAHTGEFVIPDGVTEIGDFAFSGCDRLTAIHIPESVTKIGEQAFAGCTSLTSIEVAGNPAYRFDGNALVQGNKLLWGCKGTIIPEYVEEIGAGAFADCTSLTSIRIPESVTKIGEQAFAGCTGLTSICIPSSVTEIGDWALADCDALKEIFIADPDLLEDAKVPESVEIKPLEK